MPRPKFRPLLNFLCEYSCGRRCSHLLSGPGELDHRPGGRPPPGVHLLSAAAPDLDQSDGEAGAAQVPGRVLTDQFPCSTNSMSCPRFRARWRRQQGGDSNAGTSPPARGKPIGELMAKIADRSIPASTGKTLKLVHSACLCPEHPRQHGENYPRGERRPPLAGASPPARGKPHRRGSGPRGGRSIPASTGKTFWARCNAACWPEHPRQHGENRRISVLRCGPHGASPPARGKQVQPLVRLQLGRSIPASTGKTRRRRWPGGQKSEHPRQHGENSTGTNSPACGVGASPPARGKHLKTRCSAAPVPLEVFRPRRNSLHKVSSSSGGETSRANSAWRAS